jgi:hypothetical protein
VLNFLQSAWASGNKSELGKAIGAMRGLRSLAVALMHIPLPEGNGVYGPQFKLAT